MSKQPKEKIPQHQVYIEKKLWEHCKRMSLQNGCNIHPESGSASEFVRRALKTYLLKCNPNFKNIQGINWEEIYT
jgi:hypothetical protein